MSNNPVAALVFDKASAVLRTRPNDRQVRVGAAQQLLGLARTDLAEQILSLNAPASAAHHPDIIFLSSAAQAMQGNAVAASVGFRRLINVPAYQAKAIAAEAGYMAVRGDLEVAARYFSMALELGLLPEKQAQVAAFDCAQFDVLETGLLSTLPWLAPNREQVMTAFLEGLQLRTLAGARLFQRDPLLGPWRAGYKQAHQRHLTAILEIAWEAWESGSTPPPLLRDCYQVLPPRDGAGRRLIVAVPGFVRQNEVAERSSELSRWMSRYAGSAGFQCVEHPLAPEKLQRGWQHWGPSLAEVLSTDHGTALILVAESVRLITAAGDIERLQEMLQVGGHKLIVFVSDMDEYAPDDVTPSADLADVLLLPVTKGGGIFARPFWEKTRTQLFSYTPVEEPYVEAEKRYDFCFIGNGRRHRRSIQDIVKEAFPASFIHYSNLQGPLPSMDAYFDALRSSRMTVCNGHVRSLEAVVGRSSESIATGSLLMEFDSWSIAEFYVPYVHFIPVANMDQIVQWGRFFKQNDAWRRRIVEAAHAYMLRHYNNEALWRQVAARLDYTPSEA